jgi:hypothetical protein
MTGELDLTKLRAFVTHRRVDRKSPIALARRVAVSDAKAIAGLILAFRALGCVSSGV